MTEKLLQFIWQYQYFNKSDLRTTAGEPVFILSSGTINKNQGPDFLNAQIRIGTTLLAGSVELHIRSSQWKEHGHSNDPNYTNVILHVVYEDDDLDGFSIPVLELKTRISGVMKSRYQQLMQSGSFIPCSQSIDQVREIVLVAWKERLLAERLTKKSTLVFNHLHQNNCHWEETFWWMLAGNFGQKVNARTFEAIAQSLPVTVLAKHKHSIHQLEALLLGQAGLLETSFNEEYPRLLQREYRFLRVKYKLKPVPFPVYFLRMRPGNFPTIRLAQLAMLIYQSSHLFSLVIDTEEYSDLKKLFAITANDYWHYHYKLDEPGSFKQKNLGKDMVDNIFINTLIPVLFAYGVHHNEEKFKTKALKWLEMIQGEKNSITKGFQERNIQIGSAFDTQALIELKNEYCNQKRCLECSIGNALLKRDASHI